MILFYLTLLVLAIGLLSLKFSFSPKPIVIRKTAPEISASLSVVIPARNEAHNLPILINSLNDQRFKIKEIIVVDDSSTDETRAVAESLGATLVSAPALPLGWTGKTWALHAGAKLAKGDLLLFLDADTYLAKDALTNIVLLYLAQGPSFALSIIPYHEMRKCFENLSLFFNILMCLGTDSFLFFSNNVAHKPRLVGQSLLISREKFLHIKGYESVKSEVLENFYLSNVLNAHAVQCLSILGRNLLSFRMFPDGVWQLRQGWRKSFSKGTKNVSTSTLLCSVLWLFASMHIAISLFVKTLLGMDARLELLAYALIALSLFIAARKVGNFNVLFAVFYPIPLVFYFWVYFSSIFSIGAAAEWKGRRL